MLVLGEYIFARVLKPKYASKVLNQYQKLSTGTQQLSKPNSVRLTLVTMSIFWVGLGNKALGLFLSWQSIDLVERTDTTFTVW